LLCAGCYDEAKVLNVGRNEPLQRKGRSG
jgi:hypothetical protein